jgi:hypothetical protein
MLDSEVKLNIEKEKLKKLKDENFQKDQEIASLERQLEHNM